METLFKMQRSDKLAERGKEQDTVSADERG